MPAKALAPTLECAGPPGQGRDREADGAPMGADKLNRSRQPQSQSAAREGRATPARSPFGTRSWSFAAIATASLLAVIILSHKNAQRAGAAGQALSSTGAAENDGESRNLVMAGGFISVAFLLAGAMGVRMGFISPGRGGAKAEELPSREGGPAVGPSMAKLSDLSGTGKVEAQVAPTQTEKTALTAVPRATAAQPASRRISQMIKVVDEIAVRTNILALDAAVEAARNGERGVGFALLADEVRSLAQGTARAARETVDFYEECIRRRDSALQISNAVGQRLQRMVDHARQVDDFMAEIAKTCSGEKSSPEIPETSGPSFRLRSQADALHRCVLDLQALV